MIDLKLVPQTNDLQFTTFDFSLVDGLEQIAQNLAIRLRFFLGEWYLNITEGVPYYEFILIKNPIQIQVESILKQEILDTKDVLELTGFTSSFDKAKRIFSVRFSCLCISGEELTKEMELPV